MKRASKTTGLTPKQQRFVAEYLIDLNATQASIRAGYSPRTAEQQGPRLLGNVGVQAAIAGARAKVAKRLEISAERVVAEAWSILIADPRELVEHHIGCCRHCWGKAFRYQRTAAELERDVASQADEQGGSGFNATRAPNPACTECFGKGQGRTYVNDTRNLSASAAALYAGVKQTKDGIEVKMHSKLDALDRLARLLGLNERVSVPADTAARLRAASGSTLADQGRELFASAAGGELSVVHLAQLLSGLGSVAKLIETEELEKRITALESRQNP